MKVRNTTKGDLGLGPEIICPAGGEIELTEKQAKEASKSFVVSGWFDEGKLEVVEEKKPRGRPKADTKSDKDDDGKSDKGD